ncbi:MAG: hypothetical protein ABFE07_28740 [Armatimonadia bacterium]
MRHDSCFTVDSGHRRTETEDYEAHEERVTRRWKTEAQRFVSILVVNKLVPPQTTLGDLDELADNLEGDIRKIWNRRRP